MKRFIKNLLWSLIIILVLYFGAEIASRLRMYQETYFRPVPFIVFSVFFSIFVGIIIRIPRLMSDIKNKKRLRVDWFVLTTIGIPSLYIAISPLLLFFKVPLIIQTFTINIISSGFTITTIAGVIFGYIILDCLEEK